eukprot:gene9104-biopygen10711
MGFSDFPAAHLAGTSHSDGTTARTGLRVTLRPDESAVGGVSSQKAGIETPRNCPALRQPTTASTPGCGRMLSSRFNGDAVGVVDPVGARGARARRVPPGGAAELRPRGGVDRGINPISGKTPSPMASAHSARLYGAILSIIAVDMTATPTKQ